MRKDVFKRMALCLLLAAGSSVCAVAGDVAMVGSAGYETLAEAFAVAGEGQTVTLVADAEVSEMIPVTKSLTLDLNGKTITNKVTGNRLFRLSDVTFTIEGGGGHVITPEENTGSYGFVDFRDASGVAGTSVKLIARDASFRGATDEGSLFAFRSSGQSIDFDNVSVTLDESNTFSIINGYRCKVDIKVNGGTFICRSTHATAGVFQAGAGSNIEFNGVTVDTTVGPIFEVIASKATFTDCTMTNTATNSYFATCIASSNGSDVTVSGGSYEANYALYVYNSGGAIAAEGGEFTGHVAALKADDSTVDTRTSAITVTGGVFTGGVSIGSKSTLAVSGGTFDSDITDYCTDGFEPVAVTDGDGNTVYAVAGTDCDVVMLDSRGNTVSKTVETDKTLAIDATDLSLLSVKKAVEGVDVSFKRNFYGQWEALFVPFAITLTSDMMEKFDFAEIWDTENIDGATTIEYVVLGENAVIAPNTPCLVKAKAAGEHTLEVSGTVLAVTEVPAIGCSTVKQEFDFVGTYGNATLLDKCGYFIEPDAQAFYSVTSPTAYIGPCSFYMTIRDKANGSLVYPQTDASKMNKIGIKVVGDGAADVTGIGLMTAEPAATGSYVYSLQGVCMGKSTEGLKKGVYLINGKKISIR